MLRYNVNRLFNLTGITKPVPMLVSLGIPRNTASKLINHKEVFIRLKYIEKICLKFKCTPNDLMEWTPDKPEQMNDEHPLCKLITNTGVNYDMRMLGLGIPFEKLGLFVEKVNQLKNEMSGGSK